jgi:hypothetical protein
VVWELAMVALQKHYRQLSFFVFSELESLVSSQLTVMLQKIPRVYIGALCLF